MTIPTRLRMLVPATLGAAAVTVWTESAYGFFPPLPTGSNTVTVSPPPPVFVPPTIPIPPPIVPPVAPPPFTPPALPPVVVVPEEVPTCDCTCRPPVTRPQVVPEPATIVSAAIGLSVLGGAVWKRRKKA